MSLITRTRRALRAFAAPQRRSHFPSAAVNRLTNAFQGVTLSADSALFGDLRLLRDRSRSLERSDSIARSFLSQAEKNILGANGICLQSKIMLPSEELDRDSNELVEDAWRNWSKRENCTSNGRLTWHGVQRLVLRSTLRDGECLIRFVPSAQNRHGLGLQLIESDFLDVDFNTPMTPQGNKVVMGVEQDAFNRPVAYHLLTAHPGDLYGTTGSTRRVRIPAREIVHLFIPDRIDQSRGYPMLVAALLDLHHLSGYSDAELAASRWNASKFGATEHQTPENWQGEEDDAGNVIDTVEPGTILDMPVGTKLTMFDVRHPNSGYADFTKAMLRRVAAGLGISQNTLSGDYESVNFSSMRAAAIDEHETWMSLQRWYVDNFIQPVYDRWLELGVFSGSLPFSLADLDVYNAPDWKPRRWGWVQPMEEVNAAEKAIALGIKSRRQVISDMGNDIERVFTEQQQDNELAQEYGLNFGATTAPAAPPATVAPPAGEEEPPVPPVKEPATEPVMDDTEEEDDEVTVPPASNGRFHSFTMRR